MKAPVSYFKRAKHHQQRFREEELKLAGFDKPYAHMLTDDDARVGRNFYTGGNGMMEEVKRRYAQFRKPLYKNMLRSEHIPFNFFVPLKQRKDDPDVIQFISLITGIPHIDHIDKIDFEKSPEKKNFIKKTKKYLPLKEDEIYLDDRTSFDVLITYRSQNKVGGIGIEVKYTEKSYPYGETEKKRMESTDEKELYHQTHHASEIFLADSIDKLKSKPLKQFWRNHLLGLKMIQKGDVQEFVSVQLFPEGNNYQLKKSGEYRNQIAEHLRNRFLALTFEDFINKGREIFKGNKEFNDWLDYLYRRYIVAAA